MRETKIVKFMIIISILLLTGCTRMIYLVRRNVPENPSASVFPANYFMPFVFSERPDAEIEYANIIESAVIGAGVKVIGRPGIKTTKTTKQAAKGKKENEVAVIGMTMEEYYREYTGAKPDYIIYTYQKEERIRILKRETGEILGSFFISLGVTGQESYVEIIKEILIELGIAKPSPPSKI